MYYIQPTYGYSEMRRNSVEQYRTELWMAIDLTDFALSNIRGDDKYAPDPWIDLGMDNGCRFFADTILAGEEGYYRGKYTALHPEHYAGQGVIEYNQILSQLMQAKVIAHEFFHHLLWRSLPGDGRRACYYDDDINDARHRICKIAEEIVFGQFRVHIGVSELVRRYGIHPDAEIVSDEICSFVDLRR